MLKPSKPLFLKKHIIFEKLKQSNKFYHQLRLSDKQDEIKKNNLKITILSLVVVFSLFLFIARTLFLQIIKFDYYRSLADGNRVYTKRIIAPRGAIEDRFGQPLVLNEPLYLKREKTKVKIITHEEALRLKEENPSEFQKLEIHTQRKYLYPREMAPVIGYIGEISERELENQKDKTYLIGDFIGQAGVEASYEKLLKGINGEEYYEINAQGEIVTTLGEKARQPGQQIRLTIDTDLQKQAYDALLNVVHDKLYTGGTTVKGTVIVSRVSSGEILALVSVPSFDVGNIAASLHETNNYPFMNRAISAMYQPGSTFKIITSTAGLESGKITKNTLIEDVGIIKIGTWEFPTWSSVRDGMMDIVKGIKRSNDIFFYKAGELTGLSNIDKYATQFGLGEPLGIDLPAEIGGNLPSSEWKEKTFGEPWFLGDTYHLAIGQGYLLTTPLQVNMWTNAIASRGKLYKPHVVLKPVNHLVIASAERSRSAKQSSNKQIAASPSAPRNDNSEYLIRDLHLKQETVDLIWKGMTQACQPGGTGWPLFDFKIPVACKTGTAEHIGDKPPHAWFTMFAPADKPEIAVTVLIEEGGQGSDVAAPVAKKVLEKYFEGK